MATLGQALERRQAERRAAHIRAAYLYCQSVERRKAERRKADAESVAQWLARFDAARIEGGKA